MCALNRLQRIFYWLLGGLLFHLIKMSFRRLNRRFLLVRKTTQQMIVFKVDRVLVRIFGHCFTNSEIEYCTTLPFKSPNGDFYEKMFLQRNKLNNN